MGFFSGLRKLASQIVDIRVDRWVDFKGNKDTGLYFLGLARSLFKSQPKTELEAFERVVEEKDLSDTDLAVQSEKYKTLALLFIMVAGLLLLYTIILVCFGNFMGMCISLSLTIYALSQAFRFHFWYFQIKQRKLGCSLKEWYRFVSEAKRTFHV